MSVYRVLITAAAEKEMDALPNSVHRRVTARILGLKNNPRPPGSKKLQGQDGHLRVRQLVGLRLGLRGVPTRLGGLFSDGEARRRRGRERGACVSGASVSTAHAPLQPERLYFIRLNLLG